VRALLSVLGAMLLALPFAYAQDTGLGMVEYGYVSPSEVTSYIEAKIENRGYYSVFVALPKGWTLDTTEYSVKSYAVREYGLWRVYGEEMVESGKIYTYRGSFQKAAVTVQTPEGSYTGWYLKPNEGLIIKVKTGTISGEGFVDPLKIEKQYPGIKVLRWYQEFTLKMPSRTYGWVRAPWVVRGATLVEAYPAPYSDESRTVTRGRSFWGAQGLRGEYLQADVNVPDWDEWIPLTTPLAYHMLWRPIMNFSYDEVEPDVEEYVRPVWDIQRHRTDVIRYAYEWKRGETLRGIVFSRDDFAEMPSWMELF